MAFFSEDFLEQLRYASDLVSLISEDTSLKGQGDRWTGLCPFPEHNEKTPSFSVSQSKQLYHCFGCQNSGNIFTYLQKQRGLNFGESVEYLAHKSGIPLPQKQNYKTSSHHQSFFQLNKKISHFYKQQLNNKPDSHPVKKYLKKRGWKEEWIDFFNLGYAPKGNALLNFLRDPKEQQAAKDLGLIHRSQEGERYDNFRHRLIFPILSNRRQVLGFGARALDDSLPKYINSRESQIFQKGKVLYGLNESTPFLKQKSVILIVEGYTDFLSLWQAGFKNLGATLGTALTSLHARLLKRYVDSVVLVFDGDEAGLKASERSLPLLLEAGLDVKFLSLPESQDPDDFIKSYGREAFTKKLQGAKDLFFFLLQKKHEKIKSLGKAKSYLIEEMAPLLSIVQNKALQVLYKQRLLDLFGSDSSLMEKMLTEKLKKPKLPKPVEEKRQKMSFPEESFSLREAMESERLLFVLCLGSEELFQYFIEADVLSFVKTKKMIEIFKEMIEQYRQKPSAFDSLIHLAMRKVSDNGFIFKSSYPIFNNTIEEDQKEIFLDCINFLKKREQHSTASELIAKTKMAYEEQSMHHLEKVFQLTKQRLQKGNKHKF